MSNLHTRILSDLVNYIQSVESIQGEISLFSWSHSLRCKIELDYGITDLGTKRKLYIQAYNITHPHSPYKL